MEMTIKLKDLGYNDSFETNRKRLGLDTFSIARVTSEYSGLYKVLGENGEFLARVTGKQIQQAASRKDFPAVGDWVAITELEEGRAIIHNFLPRATTIERKRSDRNRPGEKNIVQIIATNIDVALIVESVDRDYNLNRFERYLAIVRDHKIKPVIILNKVDLIPSEELGEKLAEIRDRLGDIDIIATNTVSDEGLEALTKYIVRGKTYCFLGSSGVGKSTIINQLLGSSEIKTGAISDAAGRGKHVTTNRQLYLLDNGGIVIDNPGMREVGITDLSSGIDDSFAVITALSKECKFGNCTHMHEPGCTILSALGKGEINPEQYNNYITLKKESEYYEMNEVEKREKDRQFGKFLKTAKKEIDNTR